MKVNSLLKVLILAAAVAALALGPAPVRADDAPKLLPFQGRLTDSNGNAVSNGVRLVLFRIYSDPAGGSPVWAGELHRTTVNGGLVNVMLGAKTPFTGVDFNTQLYLEITVDINGDNSITAADPPMLPRQAILPSVFSKEAAVARDSQAVNGYQWNNLPSAPPIGAVIMFWGSPAAVPQGWELCDGSIPTTPGCVLTNAKPDLRDRFPKGTPLMDHDVAATNYVGGQNSQGGFLTSGHALNLSEMPAHTHDVIDPGHSHGQYVTANPGLGNAIRADFNEDGFAYGVYPQGVNTTVSTTGIQIQYNGGNAAHYHSVPVFDNQPSYVEMLFIIRVK